MVRAWTVIFSGARAIACRLQYPVVEGLGIDADSIYAALNQGLQLLPCNGVRTAGLHCKFRAMGAVKAPVHRLQKASQLLRLQHGGGAAPHIDGLEKQALFLGNGRRIPQLLLQLFQVFRDELLCLFDRMGNKGTVAAPGAGDGRLLHRVGTQAKSGFFRGGKVPVCKAAGDFLPA